MLSKESNQILPHILAFLAPWLPIVEWAFSHVLMPQCVAAWIWIPIRVHFEALLFRISANKTQRYQNIRKEKYISGVFGFDDSNRNVRGRHTARIHLSFQDFWQFYACLFFLQFFFNQLQYNWNEYFFGSYHLLFSNQFIAALMSAVCCGW